MIRSYVFTDAGNEDRELRVSEIEGHAGVELRVGGLTVVLAPGDWKEFAELAASTLSRSRYGPTPLLVNLGNRCETCADMTDVSEAALCKDCDGRGFLPGEPAEKERAR